RSLRIGVCTIRAELRSSSVRKTCCASGATEMAEIYQRQGTTCCCVRPDPLDQTSTSLLRIASAPLIWNLAYVAPEIYNFCCYIENHLATAFLSVLAERGDFRTGRQLPSGCTACRFGKCEYGPRCGWTSAGDSGVRTEDPRTRRGSRRRAQSADQQH